MKSHFFLPQGSQSIYAKNAKRKSIESYKSQKSKFRQKKLYLCKLRKNKLHSIKIVIRNF